MHHDALTYPLSVLDWLGTGSGAVVPASAFTGIFGTNFGLNKGFAAAGGADELALASCFTGTGSILVVLVVWMDRTKSTQISKYPDRWWK